MPERHRLTWTVGPTSRPTLPDGVERMFLPSPDGLLELLVSLPKHYQAGRDSKPPLLFLHGGFGTAACYINFLPYFSSHGYPCYSLSLRGHGASHHPGFWRMYWTSKHTLALDVAFAISHIRRDHGIVYGSEHDAAGVVLMGHSSGGGISQYLISTGLEKVGGFVALAAVPGFGSYGVYWNWFTLDPWFSIRMYFRDFFHPRSPLSSTALVHNAFFSAGFPKEGVREMEREMPETESMLWPLGMMTRFVDPQKVMANIVPTLRNGRRVLVIAGTDDKLMGVRIMEQLTAWYRSAFELVTGKMEEGTDVVRFEVVQGSGHHLMRDVEWQQCSGMILEWLEG